MAVGVRYERTVAEAIELWAIGKPEWRVRFGPWLEFVDRSGKRWCQPDIVIEDSATNSCLVGEVKYQHTGDAWWQLSELYAPVLAVALPGVALKLVEICHWFDAAAPWPTHLRLVPTLGDVEAGRGVATFIYNPKRGQRYG